MLTSYLPDEFFSKLAAIAKRQNFNPEDALSVMLMESGVNGKSIHPTAPASGIFGLMFSTREEAENFTKKSEVEQLDAYEKYMSTYKNVPKPTAANLYQLNFLPASAIPNQKWYRGTDYDTVLAAKGGDGYGGKEDTYYNSNTVLDYNKDGAITVGDLANILEARKQKAGTKWTELSQRINGLLSSLPSKEKVKSTLSPIAKVSALSLLGVGGYLTYKRFKK